MARRLDKETLKYRNLLTPPSEFKSGFGWTTIAGIFFCGLVMLPGSIYLSMMTGAGLGHAATWVTVILFADISRRAMKGMNRQELVVLLHAATVMIAANIIFPGGPFGHLVYRAFLVSSDAVRDAGMRDSFPSWFCPSADSEAVLNRNFLHKDWLVPIALTLFMTLISVVRRYTLGYFLFRLTSDVENLPFPMAPIAAQGAMALAEMDDRKTAQGAADESGEEESSSLVPAGAVDEPPAEGERTEAGKRKGSKWRLFSLGAAIGIVFGAFQVGIPAVSSLMFDKPVYLIPQPFVDTTTWTEAILPATPTGIALDIGIIFIGFVLPFWAVLGTFCAILLTLILNPLLHHWGVLTHWQAGMDTVNTRFANNIDFWLSFSIGAGLGIAVVSLFSTIRDMLRLRREQAQKQRETGTAEDLWAPPVKGRGDYPVWIAVAVYIVSALVMIWVCKSLVPSVPLLFLVVFTFLYNPFLSYVNSRLLGIAGQQIEIPFIKETSFILSGAKGIDIWLAPFPIDNFGIMAQSYRVSELTGVRFWSIIKTEFIAVPVLFLLSGVFWGFIWHSGPVPSEAYPFAQVQWDYMAKNHTLLYSSTFVPEGEDAAMHSVADSQFMKAMHPWTIGTGFGVTVIAFIVLSIFGLPVMLIYGFVRGLGQFPHMLILEIVGASLGRWYFQRKYGPSNFLRMAPTILAGYFTGVGLISMATIAMKLIKNAVSGTPF